MNRFINPTRKNQYNSTLKNMSDLSRPMFSGVSRAYSSTKFTWVGDYLHKQASNTVLNPNTCYMDFISNYDILMQEYGCVEKMYTAYSFIGNIQRYPYTGRQIELITKQYNNVGHPHADIDVISYVCPSIIKSNVFADEPPVTSYQHGLHRAPSFSAFGYTQPLNNTSVFTVANSFTIDKIHIHQSTISINGITFDYTAGFLLDIDLNALQIASYNFDTNASRVVNIHVSPDNAVKEFFNTYGDLVSYADCDQLRFITMYDNNWVEGDGKPTGRPQPSRAFDFYPLAARRGMVEKAKVVARVLGSQTPTLGAYNSGYLCSVGRDALDDTDQSFITYNFSSGMVNSSGKVEVVVDGETIFAGIDSETERNRRYSAVVMTDPYFRVASIAGGEIVDYMFVDYAGTSDGTAIAPFFLKIKAPLNFLKELDRILATNEVNTDIQYTIDVKISNLSQFSNNGGFYNSFVPTDGFYARQNASLDDPIMVGGNLTHQQFTMWPASGFNVVGAGYVAQPNDASNYYEEHIRFYCCPYTPSPTNGIVPIFNGSVTNVQSNGELFRPMIKLPGINGYVKIISKSNLPGHSPTIESDGSTSTTYVVEFPYAFGSNDFRSSLNNVAKVYQKTHILYKQNYIGAGSWVADPLDDRYDVSNLRFSPVGNNRIVRHDLFTQKQSYQDVVLNGISYPQASVFMLTQWNYLVYKMSIDYKSCLYDIGVSPNQLDCKLMLFADARYWKTAQRTISYVNHENPSYVCEINLDTLTNDYTQYQANGGSIPDMKRWLYGYFQGFAKTCRRGARVSTIDLQGN